ncbi:RNA-directed DNA polymerase, eukaryota [Tanacetum coccineum]
MSKLDRFLVSESVLSAFPNINAITLERFLSDHRPILLRENHYDYGPTPFRFYHHWLEIDGFSKLVEDIWKDSPCVGSNAMAILMGKLRCLKKRIRIWNKSNLAGINNSKTQIKKELEVIDQIIDKGQGNEDVIRSRADIMHKLHTCNKLDSMEAAQKAKVKWAVEGDENSGFFHGVINKKRNIRSIRGVMVDGKWIDNPKNVKKEFLDHFSNRFSKPGKPMATLQMEFPNQIQLEQRNDLESDVTNDEIKKAVWECGTDKAPGPDGFTFGFFRKFWHLVENEVQDAVRYFFYNNDLPNGCNSSFIALIPKIPDANLVKDFRPISLIGSIYKIIAKILTNRLVGVMGGIVNEVQSAFIADRQILDGPFILNEMLSWCKKRKKQSLIFKVDFEKAYDSVRWDFLDDVLRKFGFGDKWCKWIQCCLHSSRGSIIINGSPTDEFKFGKGLKQGDPLSPFLFILIMETLHLSFQRVVDAGMFHGIKLGGTLNLSHMFYADDAVFVGEWSDNNIATLVHVLDCFHKVSGLKINMNKSKLMGTHVDHDKVTRAANKLGCQILKAPFLYLGSYVGGNMHRLKSWDDIIGRVRRRLSNWKMKMLSIGGRLTLVKSVLGSMPIFHMSLFKVPSGILRSLESIRSKFFNGIDGSKNKASWVQWSKALASKDNGGLGISSLFALNRGLIFKWVWRFVSQENSLWARVIKAVHGKDGSIGVNVKNVSNSVWLNIIREINVLSEKGINLMNQLRIKLGNGEMTHFWDDNWCEGGRLKDRFPRVYALEECKDITVGSKLAQPSITQSFRRMPRGGVEQMQVDDLINLVQNISLIPMQDRWTWTLNSSGDFSVASVRSYIDTTMLPKGDYQTRWVNLVPIKVNTFAWKVMTNSLPTRFNISRRGIDIDSISCGNCDSGVETATHLFFACDLAKQITRSIMRWWDVPEMDYESYNDWRTWMINVSFTSESKFRISTNKPKNKRKHSIRAPQYFIQDSRLVIPSSPSCANDATAINVSGPSLSKVFFYKQSLGKETWQTYAYAFWRNSIPLGGVTLQIQSAVSSSRSNSACWPIIDELLLSGIKYPRVYGGMSFSNSVNEFCYQTPDFGFILQQKCNGFLNSGFEVGPGFLESSSQGILLEAESNIDPLDIVVSALQSWEVLGTVKYIDSKHYAVPQGLRAVELVSGNPSGISYNAVFYLKGQFTLDFIMGDAGDSCVGDLAVVVQVGTQKWSFATRSNGLGSSQKYTVKFYAAYSPLDAVPISFSSYNQTHPPHTPP